VNDELDPFGCRHTDLKEASCLVGTDQHHQIVKIKDSDRLR
jgi:hypothetical protein